MPKSTHAGDYFVVGGPVQSDRACYVKRAADDRLLRAISDGRFAYVLSPRATGKSSLMARTIRRLRAEGQLAAVVDLTQIGARTEGVDAGRWYYSIAYRIVRELRLKVDLQAWWQDRSALLSEQRLVEFFGDIVLANTSAPVNVFIDEADRAIDLPFAAELFIALRSCYMRRVSEPEYSRLNFVVLGAASPELLCPDASLSPFTDGVAVELADFSVEESRRLAAGFDLDEHTATEVMDAIQRWTGGHPYLTQKVARAVARRGASAEQVDAIVRELLLAPAKIREEPLLNQIREELEGKDKLRRQARTVLARIASGAALPGDAGAAGRAMLDRIGMLRRRPDGTIGYRNRIFHSVFDAAYAKSSAPFDWRRPAIAAAGLLVAIAVPYWYVAVLPQPYIATLTVVSQDVALAEEAHRRLGQLPGFGARADGLLRDAMVRRSEQAATLGDVMAADRVLRRLPDQAETADRMLAGFWLRNAASAMHRGDRDAALVYAIAAEQGQPETARALAAELIDTDYPYLEATFRMSDAPSRWGVDWMRDQLVVIDESRRVRRFALGAQAGGQGPRPQNPLSGRLTAVQHVEAERELTVDADGVAGRFTLMLTTQHARASDLMLRLTAPDGAQAELPVPQPRADQQALIFSARPGSPLASLAEEPIRGEWSLTIVDRRAGEQGMLVSWGLQFPGSDRIWEDAPEQGIPLPDPVRTEQVETILAPGGVAAVAVPSRRGVAGALSVWDLVNGELRADIPIDTAPDSVLLLAGGARLATVTGATVTLWDVDARQPLREVSAPEVFAAPPVVSPDQAFIAFAARADLVATEVTVVAAESGEIVGESVIRAAATDWAMASGGRYVAVIDGSRWLRFFDATSGEKIGEVMHERRLERLAPLTHSGLVVAVDSESAVVAWPVDQQADGLAVSDPVFLGTTTAPDAVVLADRARRVAFIGLRDRVEVRQLANGRLDGKGFRNDGARGLQLSSAGDELVVEGNGWLRRWHIGDDAFYDVEALDIAAAAIASNAAVTALGYRAGHLRVADVGRLGDRTVSDPRVDFIGHRGSVSSVAVAPVAGIAASGGDDGVVRIWDLATVAPNEYFLRHPEGPVRALAISADGRWLASGAEYSARLWQVQSGELAAEVPVDGSATAIAFAPSNALVAVGDSAGNLFLGSPRGAATLRSARLSGAVTAIAFSSDSALIASGDVAGNLAVWNVSATDMALARATLSGPVRWLAFDGDSDHLLVATNEWLHAVERAGADFEIVSTRMLDSDLSAVAGMVRIEPRKVRVVAATARGPVLRELSLASPLPAPGADAGPLPLRNWARVLGATLDAGSGEVRPIVR